MDKTLAMNDIKQNKNPLNPLALTDSVGLAELIPDPVIEIDPNGRIVSMNRNGREKFQIDDSDLLLGISVFSLINDKDIDKCKECFEKLKTKKEKLNLKCTLLNKSNESFFV